MQLLSSISERMADAVFRPHRLARDLEELVVEKLHPAAAADHHADVADVGALGPVAGRVDEVRVLLLVLHGEIQRAVGPGDLAEADHVGLPEQDEDLDGLAQVGGVVGGGQPRDGQADGEEEGGQGGFHG